MKSFVNLPDGYNEILSIDLKKDKKLAIIVNALAILIAAVMVVPMMFYIPVDTMFSFEQGIAQYILRFSVLLLGYIVYILLHELTHGIAMKICGTQKIKYGFTGLYAFAGSNDYYDKKSYIFIALAPVVLWGIVLAVVNPFVSYEWFWVVYFIQVGNISGAAGDFCVSLRFFRLPKNILIRDYGVSMTVYSK